MSRTITGLNTISNLECETIDLTEKISINGTTPDTKKFLAYDPTTDTTQYTQEITDLTVTGEAFLYGGINTGNASVFCGALNATGVVKFVNLPTSDPNNSGQLWNDNGTLKMSA